MEFSGLSAAGAEQGGVQQGGARGFGVRACSWVCSRVAMGVVSSLGVMILFSN